MQISISFNPTLEKLRQAFDDVSIDSMLKDEIQKIAFRIERNAKQLTPVKSGRLRASIHTAPMFGGFGAKVSTNTEYAVFVHEGTRYMRSRPFMAEAVRQLGNQIEAGVLSRIDQEFTRVFKKL